MAVSALLFVVSAMAGAPRFVSFTGGGLLLNDGRVTIDLDPADLKGVSIAARNLATDIGKVCGAEATVGRHADAKIVVGTIGHSAGIDRLTSLGVINAKDLKGKCEKYIITTTGNQVVIAGSDRRGTIYGIYELSRQIGVSPWYWWADVPVEHHERIYIKGGTYTDGEPAVRYRGIFLNDEAPCLTSWVKNTYGTDYGGHDFYARVFELLLRLKANFMWPAMWGWSFYADDPLNSKTANEMGIIMGTSHHEPMARNHQEWARHRKQYGAWNYETNQKVIDDFFRLGVERAKDTEDLITIGMRGDGDEPMGGEDRNDSEYKTKDERNIALLRKIFKNQRAIIAEATGRPAKERPQVWAVYKEVQRYMAKGLKAPDDAIVLLCDDNWGDVTRLPNASERKRKGGWGMYYHVDYVGAPRNSKFLNATPIQNMWEQLHLTYEYGVDKLWVLNVGDLKPMEYPIDMFLSMAWNPRRFNAGNLLDHTREFCAQQFGEAHADEAARLLNLCCKLNGRSTAEMLDAGTYNLDKGEWDEVVAEYTELEAEALELYTRLRPDQHDAYRELILFPIQAMANLHRMYRAQAMNNRLYEAGNPDANVWADRCERFFRRDSALCAQYNNELAGGKWRGMMIQKHIGYTSWNDDFPHDIMPRVYRMAAGGQGGYVFEGSDGVVSIEAEHYFCKRDAKEACWTNIPHMGRTLGAMALMPYTKPTDGAELTYKFGGIGGVKTVKVHVVVKSTLDFQVKGGMTYEVSLDGGDAVSVNFNSRLNENPENVHSVYYPTVARRVVESTVTLPVGPDSLHTLTLRPKDPGIVFEKVVVDAGGYVPQFLFGKESGKRVAAGHR